MYPGFNYKQFGFYRNGRVFEKYTFLSLNKIFLHIMIEFLIVLKFIHNILYVQIS